MAYGGGKFRQPQLSILLRVIEELRRQCLGVVAIVDASLRHRIDDPNGLESMICDGRIEQSPAYRDADEFITELALRRVAKGDQVYVLTNDGFPDKARPDGLSRIALMVVTVFGGDELMFNPRLESLARTAI